MYNPTPEQAEIDRQKAHDTNTPHGAYCSAAYTSQLVRLTEKRKRLQAMCPPGTSTRGSQQFVFW